MCRGTLGDGCDDTGKWATNVGLVRLPTFVDEEIREMGREERRGRRVRVDRSGDVELQFREVVVSGANFTQQARIEAGRNDHSFGE